jgi:hypothetical protein
MAAKIIKIGDAASKKLDKLNNLLIKEYQQHKEYSESFEEFFCTYLSINKIGEMETLNELKRIQQMWKANKPVSSNMHDSILFIEYTQVVYSVGYHHVIKYKQDNKLGNLIPTLQDENNGNKSSEITRWNSIIEKYRENIEGVIIVGADYIRLIHKLEAEYEDSIKRYKNGTTYSSKANKPN